MVVSSNIITNITCLNNIINTSFTSHSITKYKHINLLSNNFIDNCYHNFVLNSYRHLLIMGFMNKNISFTLTYNFIS